MDFKELVSTRFSCRKYSPRQVERKKILDCLNTARVAPSACNAQPWKFVVVDDPELKEKVVNTATTGLYKTTKFIHAAPVLILILADRGSFITKAGSFIRNTRFYLIDIGIVSEHIVLQAAELGLGACHIGWFNEKGVKKLLNIPKNIEIPLLVSLGYPENQDSFKERASVSPESVNRKSLDSIASFNEFK